MLVLVPLAAGADDYKPMVREGVKWVYFFDYRNLDENKVYYAHITYYFEGEVQIGGNTYTTCWRTIEDPQRHFDDTPVPVAYCREQDRKVYAVYDDRLVARVRDYHAGYRDYEFRDTDGFGTPCIVGGEMTACAAFKGVWYQMAPGVERYLDSPAPDEYLIYDFNDLPAFYAAHPATLYQTDVTDYTGNVQRVTVTPRWRAAFDGQVTVGGSRKVDKYKVSIDSDETFEDVTHATAPANAAIDMRPNRYALTGYGIVNQWVARALPCVPLSMMCQSFLSPAASFRNPFLLRDVIDDDTCPVYVFGFCHIEDGGQIVYKIQECGYIEKNHTAQMAGQGGREAVAIEDLPERRAVVNGRTYDIQGRAVTDTEAPGIYVRNGKKVLVK